MKNRKLVFDTSALIAFWLNESGGQITKELLSNNLCSIHAANASELYFTMTRKSPGEFTPAVVRYKLDCLDLAISTWFEDELFELAAKIRLQAPELSLGDGIAIALASLLKVPIVTADRHFAKASDFAEVILIRQPKES